MKIQSNNHRIRITPSALLAVVLTFGAATTTQAEPYGNKPNGSARVSNLEWLRCSVGQAWDGDTCTGEAEEFTFKQTREATDKFNLTGYGGNHDWRVPTVRELQSLRVCRNGFESGKRDLQDGGEHVSRYCNDNSAKPTINQNTFPKTPSMSYWSSSLYVGQLNGAWGVNFDVGSVRAVYRSDKGGVRLVRTSH